MSKQSTSSFERSFVRRLSGYFTVFAALLLTLVAPQAYAQPACNVVYTISPQNSTAFGAAITIENTGTTAWTSWTLTWVFANGQTVSQLWSGVETQSGANVTVTNESYNGSIAAGGSLSGIGFNGTWNGVTNAVPASFAINGTTCGGAATGSFTLKPSAATLSIAQGASGQNERRKGDGISADNPLQLRHAAAQRGADAVDGGVDDGDIELNHAIAKTHRRQRQRLCESRTRLHRSHHLVELLNP